MSITQDIFHVDSGQSFITPIPCPLSMQTTTTMDHGIYGGCFNTRGELGFPWDSKWDYDYEHDFGSASIAATDNDTIQGFNFVSPMIAAQTIGATDFYFRFYAREHSSDADFELRIGMALYIWQLNDTKGTVFTNNTVSGFITTTSMTNYQRKISIAGHTFSDGDRLAMDVWLVAYNNKSIGVNSRWGYVGMGNSTPTHLDSSTPLTMLPGIMTPAMSHWGGN